MPAGYPGFFSYYLRRGSGLGVRALDCVGRCMFLFPSFHFSVWTDSLDGRITGETLFL